MKQLAMIPVRRRGAWVFVLIALGIVGARMLSENHVLIPSAWWFVISIIAGIGLFQLRNAWAQATAAIALLCLGAGAYSARALEAQAHDLRGWLDDTPRLVTVEGVIEQPPEQRPAQRGALAHVAAYNPIISRLRIRVTAIIDDHGTASPASGSLYVRVDEPMDELPDDDALRRGDHIRATGFARGLRTPTNPGERDLRPRAHQWGVSGSMRIARAELIEHTGAQTAAFSRFWRSRDHLRARALKMILGRGDRYIDPARSVLAALLLGERDTAETFDIESAFRRVGVAHVLAISGLHVGMVVMMVVLMVRLAGDHPRVQWTLVLLVVASMALLIPARPPIVRAVLIVTSIIVADMAGRRYDRLNMLALTAAALLLVHPLDLFSPGYQLSFGVVAGLIALTPAVSDRWAPAAGSGVARSGLRYLVQMFITSMIAWSIATPILIYHFGLISPMAAMSSVLAAPLVALALAFGYLGLALMSIAPVMGEPILSAAIATSRWLVEVVMSIDTLPGIALRVPLVGVLPTLIALLLCIAWWVVLGRPRVPALSAGVPREHRVKIILIAATAGLALWIGTSWRFSTRLPDDVVLRIDTLDVGDGSAHLIRSGNDSILFDCGSSWYGIGQRTLPNALRALGAPRVTTIVISHADIDHFSGVLDAAEQIGLRDIVTTPQFIAAAQRKDRSPENVLIHRVEAMGIRLRTIGAEEQLMIGSIPIHVLHPNPKDDFDGDNAASLVMKIDVPTDAGARQVMFFGDLDRDGLAAFRDRIDASSLRPDVIEVPHHGSARASSIDFVKTLAPQVVVQSTGPSRVNDARWREVRDGVDWRCTADGGAVSVEILTSGEIAVDQPFARD